jgi:hypothetical protein
MVQRNSKTNYEIDNKIDNTFTETYSADCDYNNSSCDQNLSQVANECVAEQLSPTPESNPTQAQCQTLLKSHRSGGSPRSSLISHHKMLFVFEGENYDTVDALPEKMSFTHFDIAVYLISIGSFLFDVVSDVVVAAFHYMNGDFWYKLDSKKLLI